MAATVSYSWTGQEMISRVFSVDERDEAYTPCPCPCPCICTVCRRYRPRPKHDGVSVEVLAKRGAVAAVLDALGCSPPCSRKSDALAETVSGWVHSSAGSLPLGPVLLGNGLGALAACSLPLDRICLPSEAADLRRSPDGPASTHQSVPSDRDGQEPALRRAGTIATICPVKTIWIDSKLCVTLMFSYRFLYHSARSGHQETLRSKRRAHAGLPSAICQKQAAPAML